MNKPLNTQQQAAHSQSAEQVLAALSSNAEGFIMVTGNAKMLIKAKYPEAPPCPTLEYKNAITINAKLNNSMFSEFRRLIFLFNGLFG